ncbi:hypothetical protein MNBD_GAMMA26-1606 [hydrothermal vent metagenome]|uniref:Uncharacterized protein n=1 Tax=hydrothermal vent metagenome TaxID=652676 RepID=A0A3B1AI00_9ZZZZ
MQNATLHIKVKQEVADGLKALSGKRHTSVGELVRQAVISSYQLELISSLNIQQKRALEAYRGNYISLSRLAEEMGMNPWDIRLWLKDHDIPQNNSFIEDDVNNA